MSREHGCITSELRGSIVGLGFAAALFGCGDARLTPLRRGPTPSVDCQSLAAQVGYATVGGETAGGKGGALMDVSTSAELKAALAQQGPLVVRVNGTINVAGQVRVAANKTIVGAQAGDGLLGGGLFVGDVDDVIVQNLTIAKAKNADAITVQNARHVWIDHCDLSSDRDNPGDYDGLVDITHQSDFVTLSWNLFHDHKATCLVGHSETNGDEDTDHLTVTFHHNGFTRVDEGSPRVRFGSVHVFNDLYEDVGRYAIVSQMKGVVLIENNVFSQVPVDWMTHYLDDEDGFVIAQGNDPGTGQAPVSAAPPVPWTPPYAYAPHAAAAVRLLVARCAGPGKVGSLGP